MRATGMRYLRAGSMTLAFLAMGLTPGQARSADYVGAKTCSACHERVVEAWRGSHHDRAMAEADEAFVLGDFENSSFEGAEIKAAFRRRGDDFIVRTAGADGELDDFKVAYVLGEEPLQRYVLDVGDGRYQVLTVVWDSRPEDKGGQRWLDLHRGKAVKPGEAAHWTGRLNSWNSRQAAYVTTGFVKGYDPETDRYDSSFEEVAVGCEACHGPGGDHVAWAENGADGDDKGLAVDLGRNVGAWRRAGDMPIAKWIGLERSETELDVCAGCHADRQAIVAEPRPGAPFLDQYSPALLEAGLYHADGQIDGETSVWGSLLQSRMHQAGVTCSDCHQAHSLELKARGDKLCAQCHPPEIFEAPTHHHHEAGEAGSACVDCHMPEKPFMTIDSRRDHRFAAPRPDLSLAFGPPNACSGCHSDRSDQWAAEAIDAWRGADWRARPSLAPALHAAREGGPSADELLASLAKDPAMAPIARATALSAWPGGDVPPAWVEESLDDPDPLIRLGAVRGLAAFHVNQRYRYLRPLLTDDVRSVRIEAARMLAPLLDAELSEEETEALKAASAELALADRVTADWPETQLALGELHALKGEFEAAEAALHRALRLHPGHVRATVALAELLQSTGRTEQAVGMLTETVHALPEEAPARFALGMALIKKGDVSKALDHLRQASEMAPDELRYAYVYGIGLNTSGDPAAAIGVLETAIDHHGDRRDLLEALATIERDRGRPKAALAHAKKLLELSPDDHGAADLVLELETTPANQPAAPRKEPPACAEC